MRFLLPSLFALWAPLVLIPIVLYLFRPRPRTVKTSTLPFFKWLHKEHQDSAWLRVLKYLLSLLLTVTVVLASAAALGRLVVTPAAEDIKTVVILVDRSASMGTVDEKGRTRLQLAKESLGQRVAGLTASVGVVIIGYDQRPEVLLARSVDRRQIERTIALIQHRPIAGKPASALQLARQLAAIETPAAIWHATDSPKTSASPETIADGQGPDGIAASDPTAAESDPSTTELNSAEIADTALEPEITLHQLDFSALNPTNIGITAVQMRRLPLDRAVFEAFVQVRGTAPRDIEATLDVFLDGGEVDLRTFTLHPGQTETLLIEIRADQAADQIAKLQVNTPHDQLPADNTVYVRIPRLDPIKVLWIRESPDPFTMLALSSLADDGDVEIFEGTPDAWPPKEAVDVAIFDDWLPEEWPAAGAIVVINPPNSVGPIRAVRLQAEPLPIADLRATNAGHPLLYGVATARIEISQTAVLQADGPLQPLWVGPQGPVLLAGESHGQRVAVIGFSPQLSTQLPFMASYPLLIGNAVYWGAEQQLQQVRGMNRRTGELLELNGEQLTWIDPEAPDRSLHELPLVGRSIELNRVGLWKTDTGTTGSSALLAAKETQIHASGAGSTTATAQELVDLPWFSGDLAPLLLCVVLGILLTESWLYHRCITN